jgi:hypothetical protein
MLSMLPMQGRSILDSSDIKQTPPCRRHSSLNLSPLVMHNDKKKLNSWSGVITDESLFWRLHLDLR